MTVKYIKKYLLGGKSEPIWQLLVKNVKSKYFACLQLQKGIIYSCLIPLCLFLHTEGPFFPDATNIFRLNLLTISSCHRIVMTYEELAIYIH